MLIAIAILAAMCGIAWDGLVQLAELADVLDGVREGAL